jgi:hypothetical protein
MAIAGTMIDLTGLLAGRRATGMPSPVLDGDHTHTPLMARTMNPARMGPVLATASVWDAFK